MYPSLKEFTQFSKEYGRITVYKEISGDMDTPVSMLSKLLPFERAILLESGKQNKTYSRFSFLAFDVRDKFLLRENGCFRNGQFVCALADMEEMLFRPSRSPSHKDLGDFIGGYVGYLNYEFVGQCGILRRSLSKTRGGLGALYLVDKFLVYDNYTTAIYLALSRTTDHVDAEDAYRAIARELDGMEEQIRGLSRANRGTMEPKIVRNIPRGLFIDKVARARDMIAEGEAIQIVLSDFLEADGIDPFEFYRNLRRINPSPYMFFMKDGDEYLVGSSPEIHLQIRDRTATLKPIAGTKPLKPVEEQEKIIKSLVNDEKEKAEHLMLVDLARNDLSRICKVGTVAVSSFMQPEVYSHVVHLVSEVNGELQDKVGAIEALRQTFPAGTVSGAPKVRAIEVIDDLEDFGRGAYAGCVGYIGFNGNLDMAITIRTAIFKGNKVRMQAGAGIVYDSVPDREYDEVMNKLLVLMKSGGLA